MLSNYNSSTTRQFYCEILLQDGTTNYDMSTYIGNFSITQSLSMKGVYIKAEVFDSLGLHDSGVFKLGAKLIINLFKNENDDLKIGQEFYITSIYNASANYNSKAKTFNIEAVSKTAYINDAVFISESLSGTPSEIAKAVLKDYMLTELTDEDETVGNISVNFTKTKPFSALQYLADNAISADSSYGDNLFFAYDTVYGFKFNCTRTMVDSNTTHYYTHFPTNDQIDDADDFYRILHHTQIVAGDKQLLISGGGLYNEVVLFNFIERTIKSSQYNYDTDKEKVSLLGTNIDVSSLDVDPLQKFKDVKTTASSHNTKSNVVIACDETAYQREDFLSKKVMTSRAQMALLRANTMTVKVTGNHAIIPGDILNIVFPAQTDGSDVTSEYDKRLTGDWLVAGVRHDVSLGVAFDTILDLYKDSMDTTL